MQGILSNRALLRASGDDVRTFLQGLVTHDVLPAVEGEAVFTALLTPQGKVLFDFFLIPADRGFLVDCDAAAAPALLKRLTLYKLRAKVELRAEPDLAVALGETAGAIASVVDPRHKELPPRAIVRRVEGQKADDHYDALRLSLGVPEFAKDFSGDEVFLLDVNYDALNAVSYKKGCFVGQEVTSRMKRKGEIRKRTLIATYDGPAPAKGASVMAGENSIGEILSGRDGSALALIRLDRLKAAQNERRMLTADGCNVRISFPAYLEQP